MKVLTVISPFDGRSVGEEISDPEVIERIEASEHEVFVRRSERAAPPVPPPEPAAEGEAPAEGAAAPAVPPTPASSSTEPVARPAEEG